MYKVLANIQIQAYPLNERGECIPPMFAQKIKLFVLDVETAEEARLKVDQLYEDFKLCQS
jgi:hypothetical protein